MKRSLAVVVLILAIIVLSSGMALASMAEVAIKVNGVGLSTEIPPLVVSGRTMVPMRTICEALGADVVWDQRSKTAIVEKSGNVVRLTVGSAKATKNGIPVELDVPAMLVEGRALVPARFIAEAFGARVSWQGSTGTVDIGFTEDRDGKSAREVLDAANAAIDAVASYRFSGTLTTVSNAPIGSYSLSQLTATIAISGAFKKPQEVFTKSAFISASEDLGIDSIETFFNGTDYYQKIGNAKWEKLDVSVAQLLSDESSENPALALAKVKDVPTIASFGDDALVAGRSHYAVYVKLDPQGFKDSMRDSLIGLMADNASIEERALMERSYSESFRNLRYDIAYKVFVDKETMIADYIEIRSAFKMLLEGEGLSMTNTTASFTIFDLNKAVEMPQVP